MKAWSLVAVLMLMTFVMGCGRRTVVVRDPRGRNVAYVSVRGAPPPPPRVLVVKTASPGPKHVWVKGHHVHRSGRYTWVKGRWVVPPRSMRVWVPGHHVAGRGWVAGHWR